jgi:hypothetical protein
MRVGALVMLVGCSFSSPTAITGDDSGGVDAGIDSAPGDSPAITRPYRRMLMLDATTLSSPIAGFPILVTLDAAACDVDFAKLQPTGADLRFFDADGTTPLPYEIERWDPAAPRQIWVRVPELVGADHIWMHYGDGTASDAQDPPAVWNPSYLAVWHMQASSPIDSVTKTAASGNGGLTTTEGRVGIAVVLDGSDDWIDAGDLAGIDGAGELTVSAWVRPASQGPGRAVFSKTSGGNAIALETGSTAARLHGRVELANGDHNRLTTAANLLINGEWGHWAFVFEAGNVRLFFNGASHTGSVSASNAPDKLPDTAGLEIGRTASFDGAFDELRIQARSRGVPWLSMEYRSMTGALVTCGPEESL